MSQDNDCPDPECFDDDCECEVCPYCGESMQWCSICKDWTSTCCIDYGTCMTERYCIATYGWDEEMMREKLETFKTDLAAEPCFVGFGVLLRGSE